MPTPHRERGIAESFGVDAARYDRTRPRYPVDLIARIAAGSRGPAGPAGPAVGAGAVVPSAGAGPVVLDVGIGTGIVARQLREAGCRVLGVEPDPRMAAFARAQGFEVEVAKFEDWEPAGRTFDAVVAGQTWHWVDPAAGAEAAARALRPGGRLALFWNAAQPAPELAAAFAAVFERLMPDSPMTRAQGVSAAQGYGMLADRADEAVRSSGAFAAVERWTDDWEHVYTRDEWLDQLPTQGLFTTLPPGPLAALLEEIGAAIDDVGGSFTMHFTTVTTTAVRAPTAS